MRSSWGSHDGKDFFLSRYGGMTIDELRQECAAISVELEGRPPNSVLLLVDPRDALITPEAIDLYKSSAAETKDVVRKTALLRMAGWKSFVQDIVVGFAGIENVKLFDDETAAREWLVLE